MSDKTVENTTPLNTEPLDAEGGLLLCCRNTIGVHAQYNPMMVCNECHQIIKCFDDENSYNKYLKFCETKGRPVAVGRAGDYFVVSFDSTLR